MIAIVITTALAALIARCAPSVGPTTIASIVVFESGARPLAIGDNTQRVAYFPTNRARATSVATALLRAGHDIDVGYMQINARNFAAYELDVASAFDPCTNVAVGSRILQLFYAGAARTVGPGQRALAMALSAYNTGDYRAGLGYARGIYATSKHLRLRSTTSGHRP